MDTTIENAEGLTSVKLMGVSLSKDKRYLAIKEERYIDLEAVQQYAHADEHLRQAFFICEMFSSYLNYEKRKELMMALTQLLNEGKIELKEYKETSLAVNINEGKIELKEYKETSLAVNILTNNGRASFIRLILSYFSPQKKNSIKNEKESLAFKHHLIKHMRHHGKELVINNIGVTVDREIKKL